MDTALAWETFQFVNKMSYIIINALKNLRQTSLFLHLDGANWSHLAILSWIFPVVQGGEVAAPLLTKESVGQINSNIKHIFSAFLL